MVIRAHFRPPVPFPSNLGPVTFLHMNYFYWQLDYSAQKPTSEKLPPYNGVIQHKHESLSVYSSDRILDSESASSNSERLGIVELHI